MLGERDVSWKKSRHEARQEVMKASAIEVLLLPAAREMSSLRDHEPLQASAKYEQILLFSLRGCVAPQRGITPIDTLQRFVVNCS